jgi:hypothetical protein
VLRVVPEEKWTRTRSGGSTAHQIRRIDRQHGTEWRRLGERVLELSLARQRQAAEVVDAAQIARLEARLGEPAGVVAAVAGEMGGLQLQPIELLAFDPVAGPGLARALKIR